MPTEKESKALVVAKQKKVAASGTAGSKAMSTALDPNTQQLYNVCLALSKSSAVPMQYIGKPDWIFSTVVLGKEFGLAPMTSLMNISSINGKPSMSVHLLLGLCMRHPQFAGWRVVKSTSEECKVEMYRLWPHQKEAFKYEGSFTIEEARKAMLIKSGGAWVSWSKNMCKARAIAFVCREAFADVLTGTYTLEEMDSEKYVDSFMNDDLKAVDELELSELNGKSVPASTESDEREPVKGTKAPVRPSNKIAPNKR